MGLFSRRGSKNDAKNNKKQQQMQEKEAAPPTTNAAATSTSKKKTAKTTAAAPQKVLPKVTSDPTLENIPQLLADIKSTDDSGDKPARALRMLFSLSEHADNSNRTHMVTVATQLVPILLEYLQQCARGSSEQYLALLVLNNISIPSPNKRVSGSGAGVVLIR
jgi:hypothetical protein